MCSSPFKFNTPLRKTHFHLFFTCETCEERLRSPELQLGAGEYLLKLNQDEVARLRIFLIVVICADTSKDGAQGVLGAATHLQGLQWRVLTLGDM